MKRFPVVFAVTLICLLGSNEIGFGQHNHDEPKPVSKEDSLHHARQDSTSALRVTDANTAASIKEIVAGYLDLKNALVNDKSKEAAAAGSALEAALTKLDKTRLTPSQKQFYEDIEEDAKEHAEHVGANAGNIGHQREHFDILSKDVYDLVKGFGTEQILYKDFCSMYNDKKGAIWLSESKTIKNPYYGKKMPTCGSVQEELK